MIITGAGGFAKELLDIFHQLGNYENIAFYDDVNIHAKKLLFQKYPVLQSQEEVADFFRQNDNAFALGLGGPYIRYRMYNKFIQSGGVLISAISAKAHISASDVNIGQGCAVFPGAVFSNSTKLGKGCIVYYNTVITHDCTIGDFVQISPGVCLLGNVIIDDFVLIGANATILPRLRIGKYAIIAAGATVTGPVEDYAVMAGCPARISGWNSAYGAKLIFDEHQRAVCPVSGEEYVLYENKVHLLPEQV
jgi:sugar O-acyltransferase (sialic acid O-acetyltransferase NeuD family)